MLQTLITLLIVAAACGYSVWKLAPAGWRRGFARHSGQIVQAAGVSAPVARRIEIRVVAAAESSGGCGSCGPCKACKTGDPAAAAESGSGSRL